MRLIYDNIVFGIQRYGGISVVWQELLSHVSRKRDDIGYIDVKSTLNYSRSKLDIQADAVVQRISCPRFTRYLPVRMSSNAPFLFHSSYYRYCTSPQALNITTVHDFTYELFAKGAKQKMHTWQKFLAIRHSAAVVCISENTKRDLLRLMPDVDGNKVRVIYNGVSSAFRIIHEEPENIDLPFSAHSYVIFIGRRDPYKNFNLVVKCVSTTSLNLVVIGQQLNDNEKAEVERYLPLSRYQCLSHVSDERLNELYNYSAALVYPSSYEGFGLPVLEAQRAGCPVIALNSSSIPEVIGTTPLLMDNLSEEELSAKLRLLSHQELMKQVKADGLINTRRFSWEKTGADYMELYQSLGRK